MKQDRLEPHPNGTFLRIKRVAIFGLFRLYDHDIPLHMEDRVTILHGPNGVGKTAILRLLAAAFGGRYAELTKVPFRKLDIELSDDSVITFEQTEKYDKRERTHLGLKLSLKVSGEIQNTSEITLGSPEQRDTLAQLAAAEYSSIERLGPDLWVHRSVGEEMSTADAYDMYYEGGMVAQRRRRLITEPEWFTELRGRVQVHLIETQRLLRMNPPDSALPSLHTGVLIPAVRDYARDLQTRITEALARYATESQSLDQSFPQRLVKAGSRPGLATSDLKARMSGLDVKRAELQKIGLLDSATSSPFDVESLDDLDSAQSSVMSLYVEDTQKKLAVLDELSQRITILLGNVNGKFRNKSIQIHRDKGFVVIGPNGVPLDANSLSSGEQHELVLLYDLLFRVRPGTLVLIDEPELSLHVGWQKRFLPDLLEIVRTAEFDALIATHSPFIVGDRSDLMVPLAADIDT
jgi:AAA domain, putative AbiEii toxin, Type IV TA system/AAA domain